MAANGRLVLCHVLKIRTGQVGGFQPEHPAMHPGYRSTHGNDYDRRKDQQHEVDDRSPTEECGYCFNCVHIRVLWLVIVEIGSL